MTILSRSKFNFRTFSFASCATLALLTAPAIAQEANDEQVLGTVTVTGSFITGTPEDAALPVDVVTAADLRLEGKPNITELIRNLGVSSGVDGQTNQFGSNGLEGTSNINLRGLGAGRTLVLLNGRRQNFSPVAIGEQAQLFVDTNMIPTAAIGRIEVLKDGAAALYGSDAIAGVANFITNDSLKGLEIAGSFQTFDGSDGEYDVSAAYGFQGDDWNWVTSVGYQYRSEVALISKDWAILPFDSDGNGQATPGVDNPVGGWSTIGSPGSFLAPGNIGTGIAAAGTPLAFANSDDGCAAVGGTDGTQVCRFQFTQFDNLVEEEARFQLFSEYNRTLNNGIDLHLEVLYGSTDVPSWKTSPSYPPQDITGQVVLPNHPALTQFIADNPAWAAATFADYSPLLVGGAPDLYDPSTGTGGLGVTPLLYFGRSFGWGGYPGTGGAQEGSREYSTLRLAGDLSGTFEESGVNWNLGLTHHTSEADRSQQDSYIAGFGTALAGFGVCTDAATGLDPATGTSPAAPGYTGSLAAGTGTCEYYNPFSNAIATNAITGEANPGYVASLANSTGLADWLTGEVADVRTTTLTVLDGVLSGGTGFQLSGGEVQYAAGFQFRRETYKLEPNDLSNLEITPGAGGTGPFSFLAGTNPADEQQIITALFGELQIPVSDRLDIQTALRYEDYGGETGSTLDPKIAAKFSVTNSLSLRGSAQTSFKGPTLNQLAGTETILEFIPQAGNFKAVDRRGSADLSPESATSFNLGAIYETDRFNVSVDYYNFDFSDPIIVESQSDIVGAALAALGTTATTDDAIISRVVFQDPANPTASGISRVLTNVTNGPDIKTSGVDVRAEAKFNAISMDISVGGDASYILEYDVDDFSIEGTSFAGGDRVGQFNRSNFSRSMPQWKSNFYLNLAKSDHNLRLVARYVDSYVDERGVATTASAPNTFQTSLGIPDIDSQLTFDAFYTWAAPYGLDLGLSVVNITDEDPPFAQFDLGYDAYTHNPFGRTLKLSVSKSFGGE